MKKKIIIEIIKDIIFSTKEINKQNYNFTKEIKNNNNREEIKEKERNDNNYIKQKYFVAKT